MQPSVLFFSVADESRQFGFVHFCKRDDAERAVEMMDPILNKGVHLGYIAVLIGNGTRVMNQIQ